MANPEIDKGNSSWALESFYNKIFGGTREIRKRSTGETDLSVCPECASELVYPTDWAPASARKWQVELRCPDCEWEGGDTYSQDVVDRFDEVLDDGSQSVLDDLNKLTHANMEEEIERFAGALSVDAILPEDF